VSLIIVSPSHPSKSPSICTSKNLIKSTTELILNFIKLNCPLRDKKEFYTHPYTEMKLGITWQNIYRKIDKIARINSLKEHIFKF